MAETAAPERRARRRGADIDPHTLGAPLAVPYERIAEAKLAGAVWIDDGRVRCWFAPAGDLPDGLRAFLPSRESTVSLSEAKDDFLSLCREVGIDVERLDDDGKMHRVPLLESKNEKKNGAYWFDVSGDKPHGYAKNWKTGEERSWVAGDTIDTLPPEEKAARAAAAALARERLAIEREQRRQAVAKKAAILWRGMRSRLPAAGNAYLERKGVGAHGVRFTDDGAVVVPMRDIEGALSSLQFIDPDGGKRFLSGGAKAGRMHVLGHIPEEGEGLLIAEGYATAASLHEATGLPVAVAFDAGNLLPVAEALRERYPSAFIAIMADNDRVAEAAGEPNVGVEKAKEAAIAVRGVYLAPLFPQEIEGSDWNDLAHATGFDAMRDQACGRLAHLWGKWNKRIAEINAQPAPAPADDTPSRNPPEVSRRAGGSAPGVGAAPAPASTAATAANASEAAPIPDPPVQAAARAARPARERALSP